MKFLILTIVLLSTNCNAKFEDCNLWYSYVENLKNEISHLGYGSIDMDKTFSQIKKNESISHFTSSILSFEGKYTLPFFRNGKYKSLKLDFSNKDNDKGFFYKSNDIKLFSIIDSTKDAENNIDHIYIPKPLQGIHGYAESLNEINDYESMIIQFENKFSDFKCDILNKNWLYYAYPFYLKASTSFSHANWYHISKNNFELIVSKSENLLNMKFYLENEIVIINTKYVKGINNSEFEHWLINISEI